MTDTKKSLESVHNALRTTFEDGYREGWKAALAQQQAQAAGEDACTVVPDGFWLAPVKSTDAMRYAWMDVYDEKGWNSMPAMWDAVRAAAPATPPAPIAVKPKG